MNIPYVFKKCNKCGQLLVANKANFYKDKSKKYGLSSWCRACANTHQKQYQKQNRAKKSAYDKKYKKEHMEWYKEFQKNWRNTPQGKLSHKNDTNRRRTVTKKGNGYTLAQQQEMLQFFDFKCAYSGIALNKDNINIDHIVPLAKDGEHEIWNLVPMYCIYNFSKSAKNMLEWYSQQEFYSEDRLQRILEWQEYAYNKYGKQEEAQ